MELPIININGTSRKQLLEQYLAALEALRDTIKTVHDACPHGRDYVYGGSINVAIAEHSTRLSLLYRVRDEIEKIALHVSLLGVADISSTRVFSGTDSSDQHVVDWRVFIEDQP